MNFLRLLCGWVNMNSVVHIEEAANGCMYLYYHPRDERGQYLYVSDPNDVRDIRAYLDRNTWTNPQRPISRIDMLVS